MAVITGLKSIKKVQEKPKIEDGPRARWLKVEDGQSVKVRFVNELDPDSPHYNASRGLAIVVSEHTNPKNYRCKAVCTLDDEGRCFGCEMYRRDPKSGWKSRLRFYINALVDDGNEKYVAVWSQGVSSKSPTTTMLLEYAEDTQSVTNLQWRLKRSGTGTQTSYALIPLATDSEPFDWSSVDVFDLEKVAIRNIAYPDQEAFYMGVEIESETTSSVEW